MSIQTYNRQRTVSFPKGLWDKAFQEALRVAGHPDDEVEVTFLSNRSIAGLNKQWRGRKGPTDCLSFPSSPDIPVFPGQKGRPLGDIVISLEQARIQGAIHPEDEVPAQDALYAEVLFLFIHSLLHLLGYDHETSTADEAVMTLEQNRIFSLVADDVIRRC